MERESGGSIFRKSSCCFRSLLGVLLSPQCERVLYENNESLAETKEWVVLLCSHHLGGPSGFDFRDKIPPQFCSPQFV